MLSSILIGSLNLSYQLIYFSLTFYGKQQNFSLTKRREKSRFRKPFPTDETTEKKKNNNNNNNNRKWHTGSDKKNTNFGLKLFNGTPKFPYKFKEIISLILPYVELLSWLCNNNKKFTSKIFRMACKSLQE